MLDEVNKTDDEDIARSERRSPNLAISKLMHRPSILLAGIGVYLGIGLVFMEQRDLPLSKLLLEHGLSVIGTIIGLGSAWYMIFNMAKFRTEDRFIDIDSKRSKSRTDSVDIANLIGEMETLKQAQPHFDYGKIEALIKKTVEPARQIDENLVKSFENYFNGIRHTLEEKASLADEKASVLLDKGTAYSRWGIVFFIVSIIIWQVLSWKTGFQTQFIFGIVSCSVLFIFIEFLSAWFLKQYRQFVDTSTYLIKVKSIFDKYMLAYLVLKEVPGDEKEDLKQMFSMLKEDIKWPETYLLKSGDVNFAKETMETMTYLLKTMKETAKD